MDYDALRQIIIDDLFENNDNAWWADQHADRVVKKFKEHNEKAEPTV